MAAQATPDEQLLELLLTLKRTTPAEARGILNSQPQIAYALMAIMVNINAVKMEVVQDILTKYGALGGAPPTQPTTVAPPPAIPPHMQPQPPRGGTPTYPHHGTQNAHAPQGYQAGPPAGPARGYGTPPPNQVPGFAPPHAAQQPPQAPGLPHAQLSHMLPHAQQAPPAPGQTPVLPEALAALPEDQKVLIMRVIAMTRDEVYQMPPADRENIIKLRTTLGLPT